MPSNLVEEPTQSHQYYVGPNQTGTQNYQASLRLVHALGHMIQFWTQKVDENKEVSDHNSLMVLTALFSICDNLHDHLELVVKSMGALKGELGNEHLPKAMKDMNQTNINYNGQKFVLSGRFTAKFTDENKGFEWLREINEFGAVKFNIHHATLSSIVKRKIEEDLVTPPDHVKVTTQDFVAIRKA